MPTGRSNRELVLHLTMKDLLWAVTAMCLEETCHRRGTSAGFCSDHRAVLPDARGKETLCWHREPFEFKKSLPPSLRPFVESSPLERMESPQAIESLRLLLQSSPLERMKIPKREKARKTVTESETSTKDLWLSDVKNDEINASLADKLSRMALAPVVEGSQVATVATRKRWMDRPVTAKADANVVPARL